MLRKLGQSVRLNFWLHILGVQPEYNWEIENFINLIRVIFPTRKLLDGNGVKWKELSCD